MRSTNALSPQAESKPKTCAARTDAIRLLRRSSICGRCSKSSLLRAVTPALRTERSSSALLWLVNERTPFESQPYAEQSRSEEHTSELQSLMRISYAVFRLKQKNMH